MGMAALDALDALDALSQRIVARADVRGIRRDQMGAHFAHRVRQAMLSISTGMLGEPTFHAALVGRWTAALTSASRAA